MKVIVSPEPLELGNTWYGVCLSGSEKDIYCLFQTKSQAEYYIHAINRLATYEHNYKIVIVKVHS